MAVLQKGFHSVCNGTFSHNEGKKEKAKVWMTLQPFEPQVKYHCVSVSPEWLSPNTPVTADWKSMRTFVKATKCPLKLIQKMSVFPIKMLCLRTAEPKLQAQIFYLRKRNTLKKVSRKCLFFFNWFGVHVQLCMSLNMLVFSVNDECECILYD